MACVKNDQGSGENQAKTTSGLYELNGNRRTIITPRVTSNILAPFFKSQNLDPQLDYVSLSQGFIKQILFQLKGEHIICLLNRSAVHSAALIAKCMFNKEHVARCQSQQCILYIVGIQNKELFV